MTQFIDDLLLPSEIQKHIKTKVIGQNIYHFNRLTSTNKIAKDILHENGDNIKSGTVLIAEEQTDGIGRLNRVWHSPKGGIWSTIIVKPNVSADQTFIIMMAVSLALTHVIRHDYGLPALIKWPNDIYIGDKKVAGITVELSTDDSVVKYCIIGIGIDVNIHIKQTLPHISNIATSISDELGHKINRSEFFAKFLNDFEQKNQQILQSEIKPLFMEWKCLSYTLHRHVDVQTFNKLFTGYAIDIDEKGALIVQRDDGSLEKVISGDCTLTFKP